MDDQDKLLNEPSIEIPESITNADQFYEWVQEVELPDDVQSARDFAEWVSSK